MRKIKRMMIMSIRIEELGTKEAILRSFKWIKILNLNTVNKTTRVNIITNMLTKVKVNTITISLTLQLMDSKTILT